MTDDRVPSQPDATSGAASPRADIADRTLIVLLATAAATCAVYFLIMRSLPEAWQTPGSTPLHLCAVAGSVLLLVPMGFALAKRTGRGGSPPRWFVAHVAAATVGLVLVTAHTSGRIERPPALLLLALVGLAVTGAVARVRLSADIAATFGTKRAPFRALETDRRDALKRLIKQKCAVLADLDPGASEATFSVTLAHWMRAPRLASAYARLARRENRLMGTRRSVGAAQAYWRPFHLLLAYGFVIGLLIHIVVVTFFAGYVAGDRDITWWHIAAW